ncbi:hypothetical protein CEXT_387171 [Caerostris extrusa]|uniref:Uncharacterized protein n=1 Tax=Caerostris extrusa TaxID=172846 RepID=A0AAV4P5L6_CAEEX|nr:hypothetical protein CEXT_387171 [Caerostris extrusa]
MGIGRTKSADKPDCLTLCCCERDNNEPMVATEPMASTLAEPMVATRNIKPKPLFSNLSIRTSSFSGINT